ncbi:hypothetical protein ES332_A03G110800v1 [Gossypium tomentosum]|uniref:Uncharacterized protein n=1 Tax=Gossypium tomentosum TaxID=34277 RepID=A0A5D2R6G0_GOSTO|nr:hypothetical protein ES332_A03G110800v1 [Gossypium tomentosum]
MELVKEALGDDGRGMVGDVDGIGGSAVKGRATLAGHGSNGPSCNIYKTMRLCKYIFCFLNYFGFFCIFSLKFCNLSFLNCCN